MEKLETLDLYNEDCFNVFPLIKEKSVDLFVLDLPYNQTACKWDKDIIPLDKMWEHIKRIMKPNGIIIHFCTAKFGYRLIHSNPKWFRYDLIWKKSRKVGFLSANKMPLRQHENIYLFSSDIDDNDSLKDYSKKILNYIGLPKTEIKKTIKDADHFFRYSKDNFCLCAEETYNKLIEIYKIDKMEGFIKYDKLKTEKTYNPQKTEGTPYILGRIKPKNAHLYGKQLGTDNKTENKGDRHPSSIIDHENIYLFSHANNDDLDISRNKDLRAYAQKVKDYIGKGLKQINKDMGNRHAEHFFYIKSTQFGIPTEETYNKLIELYKLDKMNNFIPYETLKGMWEKNEDHTTYNPQKTKGKPYLIKEHKLERNSVYGTITVPEHMNKTGDRHPASLIEYEGDSILIYKNPHKTIHRTQKPVELVEWLIKTYSNEEDTVMDFTMGSGTTGIACLNTNRKFIGVEKDSEIYALAQNRIIEHVDI